MHGCTLGSHGGIRRSSWLLLVFLGCLPLVSSERSPTLQWQLDADDEAHPASLAQGKLESFTEEPGKESTSAAANAAGEGAGSTTAGDSGVVVTSTGVQQAGTASDADSGGGSSTAGQAATSEAAVQTTTTTSTQETRTFFQRLKAWYREKCQTPEYLAMNLTIVEWKVGANIVNPYKSYIQPDTQSLPPDVAGPYTKFMEGFSEIFDDKMQEPLKKLVSKDKPLHILFDDHMFSSFLHGLGQGGIPDFNQESSLHVRYAWEKSFFGGKGLRDWSLDEFIKHTDLQKTGWLKYADEKTAVMRPVDSNTPLFRPSVVTGSTAWFANIEDWWKKWKQFMMQDTVRLGGEYNSTPIHVAQLVSGGTNESKSDQPVQGINFDNQADKDNCIRALRLLLVGIYDAMMLHLATAVNIAKQIKPTELVTTRDYLLKTLINSRMRTLISILAFTHGDADLLFLQDANDAFRWRLVQSRVGSNYHIIVPHRFCRLRYSIILLSKAMFVSPTHEDHLTQRVVEAAREQISSEGQNPDDLKIYHNEDIECNCFFVSVRSTDGIQYLLGSLNPGKNPRRSAALMRGLLKVQQSDPQKFNSIRLFGLSAMAGQRPPEEQHEVLNELIKDTKAQNLTSLGTGKQFSTAHYITSHLQPLFRHGSSLRNGKIDMEMADIVPADHIFSNPDCLQSLELLPDNTGLGNYTPGALLPTSYFPAEHSIVKGIYAQKPCHESNNVELDMKQTWLARACTAGALLAAVSMLTISLKVVDLSHTPQICQCGNMFLGDSKFCRKCGAKRPDYIEASQTREQAGRGASTVLVPADATQCYCGNVFALGARFCRRCGARRDI
eukprot:TRINITY_DN33140_c0_g1_i1.p1 TRINITY_DN33140_c0_g1~~TRINITY_DN33140_c0_g1_i1.p1  ORF type:complete len:836 (-),score=143.92 TRINITY_DN33140_c0_g1_i1:34-2541(-)